MLLKVRCTVSNEVARSGTSAIYVYLLLKLKIFLLNFLFFYIFAQNNEMNW
jgi:hypothetical protein